MLVGDILEDKEFNDKKASFKLGTFIKEKILNKYGIAKNTSISLPKNNIEPIEQKENSIKNLLPHDENRNI